MRQVDCLVIGAGPTGLGAAWRLDASGHDDWLLCEGTAEAGGLAGSVVDDDGFTWDFGGHVQFSHYDYFDDLMDSLLGRDGWYFHDRESWVRVCDRFVPYPFQLNLQNLPDDDAIRAIVGLIHAARSNAGSHPSDFGSWIDATFGPAIAALFMRPYNTKVWARAPERMAWDWIGERVALVDLPRVVENLRLNRQDVSWGPNNRFRFPKRGGTGVIWRTLARRLETCHPDKFQWNQRLVALDTEHRRATFSDGHRIGYQRLVTTIPVDELVMMSDLASSLSATANRLEHSTTHVIGIGLHGKPGVELANKCWLYFPESNCPFYRVTHFSHYSPYNVADPDTQWSLMAEVAESSFRPLADPDVVGDTVRGLVNTALIESAAVVHHTWHRRLERGYPVPSLDRDAVLDQLRPVLEERQVFSRGRFGAWKYEVSNQDHSFAQGVEVIDHLLHDGGEETLNQPNAVNSRVRAPR